MKLDYKQTYPAEPARVVELLRNEDFISDVARHAGATEHRVEVRADATLLSMRMPVPEKLTKFVGETIQLNQTFRFTDPGPDGVAHGTVDVDVPGMPVDVDARGVLRPEGDRTIGHYTGDVKVKIPLIGKKVEAQVEPFIREAFDGIERRAADWLTR
ncbi:DUF2505 domain-containing protein [Tessaracoccus flavus]|jgi:hypothetical protein|uniref:Uncharacterized protein n=1 Tax=Tessaracoccus flavus TaxID=1610493 RepID=A0A1Q2CDY2_9ACTN|nr:DUF2505 domain-containing protein [Tessaracoccus flavus]AQP44316.1 hypothetical protein RPIT_05395 [Tessaracoccus flavus]SDY65738.1 Protein of unknown function [Tessaracoccus flavus]